MFAGTHTAIITPFQQGKIDEAALAKLVDLQFDAKVSGIVPCGTTGESPTLDHEEHLRVIELAARFARGRGVVMAGTGSNCTREAVELTQAAQAVGATAILQVAPYYNKPSPEGLIAHFTAVAKATSLPIMLYSIPGRCGIEISLEVIAELNRTCPNICAIKEAGGNPERVNQMKQLLPASFEILSGDDSLTLPFMAVGAVGVVSVASNLIPGPIAEMVRLALAGDFRAAGAIHHRYYPLLASLLKLSTNPIPIKAAMSLAGHCQPELRLPMIALEEPKLSQLREVLGQLGLI
jgi:4-hydroxy-tetrahydrodipicolinate synthase